MAAGTWPGDLIVQGRITAQTLTLPTGTIVDSNVASNAAINASKIGHRVFRSHSQNGTAVAETRAIHVASAAGSINRLAVGAITAATTGASVTVDLKKNGASVLGSVVTLDATTAARGSVTAAITSPTYAAGDFFELVIAVTAGGGTLPTGLIAEAAFDEAPQ